MADAPPPYTETSKDGGRIGFVEPAMIKSSAPPATNPNVFVETVHYQQQTTTAGGPSMAHSMSAGSVTAAAYPAYPQQHPSQPQFEKAVQGQYQYPPYAVPPPHQQGPYPQYPYPPGHFSAPTGYPPQQQQPIQYMMAPQQFSAAQPNVFVVNTSNQQQQATAAAAPTRTVIIQQRRGVNHLLHFLISLIFPPWIFVWILLCICDGS